MATPTWSLARRGMPPTALPAPGRDYSRSPVRIGNRHTALRGARTADVMAVKRDWSLSWAKLTDGQFRLVEQYADLSMGLGPFEWREPAAAGMVLVNIVSLTETTPLYTGWHTCVLQLEQV